MRDNERPSSIVAFPMPKSDIEPTIRFAATSEGSKTFKNVLASNFEKEDMWRQQVSTKQIHLCLSEGKIQGEPTLDENSYWVCTLYRICAGQPVYLQVAVGKDQNGKNQVIAMEFSGDEHAW